jgi:hypothetical protein
MTSPRSSKRTRRGSRKPAPPCAREGCLRHARKRDYRHCSVECATIDRLIDSAQEACTEYATAEPELTTSLWVATTSLNDALTEFLVARTALHRETGVGYQGRAS